MFAWVVYGLATWPCPKVEGRRYVCSSHHWPLRWPSTNDERDGPLLIPFDSGFPTHTTTVFATCCYISANQVCTCRCGCKLMCFCGACECACACVWMNALTYVGMYGCLHVWMDTWVDRWKDRSNVLTCTILYSVVL